MRASGVGLSEDAVYASVMDFYTARLFLMTLPVLVLWVCVFWGGVNRTTAGWFPLGTIGAAAFWAVEGWKPWRMVPHRMIMGLGPAPVAESPIQRVTARFFSTPRCRLVQGLWVATGAGIPWLIARSE